MDTDFGAGKVHGLGLQALHCMLRTEQGRSDSQCLSLRRFTTC